MTVEASPIAVRNIREDELVPWFNAVSTSVLDRPEIGPIAELAREHYDLRRVWAAFAGDRICGTFRSWATELTVPGGRQVATSAVTGVGVLPTHRRRGVLRAMAAAEHAAARERGEPIAALYASEYPIYGRLGYGPACRVATWTLNARGTGFHGTPGGAIEIVAVGPESRETIRTLFDGGRRGAVGEIRRRGYWWDVDLGLQPSPWDKTWKGFLALHRDDEGVIDGYVRYHADEIWEERQPRVRIVVDDLQALSDEAYAALWRFLAEIDLVATVKAENRSPTERLPWLLTNARAAVLSELGDGLWLRLLDVERALGARTYETAGRMIVEVVDPELDGGRVRLNLEASPDGVICRPTDSLPDLTVPVGALGAVYLGGTRLRDAVLSTGVDQHRPGALAEADALFRTVEEPWCSTFF